MATSGGPTPKQNRPSTHGRCPLLGAPDDANSLRVAAVHLRKPQRPQGSLHYTPEHCLVNGGFPLFCWKKQHVSNGCKMYLLRSPGPPWILYCVLYAGQMLPCKHNIIWVCHFLGHPPKWWLSQMVSRHAHMTKESAKKDLRKCFRRFHCLSPPPQPNHSAAHVPVLMIATITLKLLYDLCDMYCFPRSTSPSPFNQNPSLSSIIRVSEP